MSETIRERECIKDYRRRGNTYNAGEKYEISNSLANADQRYFGVALWKVTSKKKKIAKKVGKKTIKNKGKKTK